MGAHTFTRPNTRAQRLLSILLSYWCGATQRVINNEAGKLIVQSQHMPENAMKMGIYSSSENEYNWPVDEMLGYAKIHGMK